MSQRARIYDATTLLLDIAVACAFGEMNEAALHAAEVVLRRTVLGRSTAQPKNPAEYCAEKDAEILDWYVTTSNSMGLAREQAYRDLKEWRQRHS